MTQIFHPSANTLARVSIVAGFFSIAGLLVLGDALQKSTYVTEVNMPREQVVPFSHKHHMAMGLDCRYCHTSVEEEAFAGIPPTRTCMNCHKLVWNEAPILQPVRDSWMNNKPLEWNRVHDLPQFAYFNHSAHVNAGVGCSTCHGRVDEMPLVHKQNTLYMSWCLDCHRAPENFVRPRDQVFNMAWEPPADQVEEGKKLLELHKVDTSNFRMLDCYKCHR
ncbi:MAG: cytochrome c3 family protein [Verrucomicrobia bacterium]|nr:cytochrome c3 family protein [Kiritimatiellia bacterium]MCP5488684.1 cytochrome c3 family protein [Verrucomicrobiota bacterium]